MTGKVVFDTSSLVGAALRSDSIPDRAVTLALSAHQLCVSGELLEELERVLKRKRLDAYVDLDSRITFLEMIRANAQLVDVSESTLQAVKGTSRDVKDDFVLALAIAAGTDGIVSSDHDLLVLHPWRGVAIVTPAEFIEQFND